MIVSLIDTTIATYQQVIGVFRIYPNGVIVNVFVDFPPDLTYGFPTIITHFIVSIGEDISFQHCVGHRSLLDNNCLM
jgi:hypothetical protein